MANKPNNPALWSRAKSMAKQKFDVYPSAYANGWAAKWYKSKGGTWRKAEYGMEVRDVDNASLNMFQEGGDTYNNSPVPYSNDFMDKLQSQYNRFYAGPTIPYEPYGKDDGFDGFYHHKINPLMRMVKEKGWLIDKPSIPDFQKVFIKDDGINEEPMPTKKTTVKKVDDYYTQHTDDNDWSRITKYLQEQARVAPKLNAPFMKIGGQPDNPGFRALPPAIQQKIMDNMKQGGEKMPAEIARARFAAAGNLDKMSDYGYAYGGYIPEMMYGGNQYMQQGGQQEQIMQLIQAFAEMNQMDPNQLMQQLQEMPAEQQQQAIEQMAQSIQQASQQPDMTQAAMAYGGYTTGIFAEGGEPNGGMALGQMSAVADKMSKLRQFVSPDQNLDPWIASKLATMDESADAISDYMMYNPEFQEDMMGEDMMEEENEQEEMPEMGRGGYTVTRSNDRKGKTHKVTGPDGTVKYFGDSKLGQHPKDPERKKAFYARHKKNLAGNPYFRAFARATWKDGGSTFSGNAFYQGGGAFIPEYDMAFPADYAVEMMRQGGIHLDPSKRGTFKAQATRMGMGVQEAASTILGAPEGRYSPAMRKKANFAKNFAKQMGGPVEGEVLDVSPEQLEALRQQGYQFEIM